MKFGLIGHPIAHSLSPALFKAGFDGRYPYELIETSKFEDAYQRFLDGYDGINVTAPFKELAYCKADIISEECRLIGATNLLIKTSEGVAAYNSDYRGLCAWIQGIQTESQSRKALIIGLGGAGKAAAAAAWNCGLELTLMNRDITKAADMSSRLGGVSGGKDISVRPLSDFPECFHNADIIIYNLPVSIAGPDDLLEATQPPKGTQKKHLLEANYKNPSFTTEHLNRLQEGGLDIEYHPGQTWLLMQAVTGYEIFTGEKPDLSRMSEQI